MRARRLRDRPINGLRCRDTIRTECEVLEMRPTSRPDRGIVVFRDHICIQHGAEVFCNDKTVLLKRRG